ncbi:hypothetical protein ABT039_04200 [Streptomyces lasiicapitis]|uniref:hypothetical protein n=1 Tax=Streptomyces lasiicapitis TaxID=1923961 RepID=UPI00331E3F79
MVQIRLESIHCVEATESHGEDETYALIAAVDLDHKLVVGGFPIPIPASEITLHGPYDIDNGDTVDLSGSRPVWGLNTGAPAELADPDRAIFVVALVENDDGDASAARTIAQGAVVSAVFGALGESHGVLAQRIIQSLHGSVRTPTGFPDTDDPIGDPQELHFTTEELKRAAAGEYVRKEITISGGGGEYRLTFSARKRFWTPPPSPAYVAAEPQRANQLDALAIDGDGVVNVMWVEGTGAWHGPLPITAAVAPPGGPLALARQTDNQLDAVFVDKEGAVNVMWVVGTGSWQGPVRITPTDYAPRNTAHIALAKQTDNQLDAVFIDKNGAVNVMWVTGTDSWHEPVPITAADYAPPGGPIALAKQTDNQLDAVFVDKEGAVNVMWVVGTGSWHEPVRITPTDYAPRNTAHIALAKQTDNQLDAVFIDKNGAVNVMWVTGTGSWQGPVRITATDYAPRGGPVALAKQTGNQLDAVFVDKHGAVNVIWVVGTEAWHEPVPITAPYTAPNGGESGLAPIVLARQTPDQLDAFFVGNNGAVNVLWVTGTGSWQGPAAITH